MPPRKNGSIRKIIKNDSLYRKKTDFEEELFKKAALSEAERLAAEEAAKRDILDIQNERNLELKQDIRKFTEENPEIAASMIRIWLKGEGGEANG